MLFLIAACRAPPVIYGLTISVVFRFLQNIFVEGDSISYLCTGDGYTNNEVISVCKGNGQWSLQTLPTCCKLNLL